MTVRGGIAALTTLLFVAACTSGPRANAVIRVTPDGVRVTPVVTGTVGGVGVAVTR